MALPLPTPGFLRSALSESSGEGSVARVGVLSVVWTALGWVTFLLVKDGRLPPLDPLSLFVASIVGTLYGTNKIAAAIVAVKPCTTCDTPAPAPEPETSHAP